MLLAFWLLLVWVSELMLQERFTQLCMRNAPLVLMPHTGIPFPLLLAYMPEAAGVREL